LFVFVLSIALTIALPANDQNAPATGKDVARGHGPGIARVPNTAAIGSRFAADPSLCRTRAGD
jgi:hypothetical protein